MAYILLIVSSLQRFLLQKQTQQQCSGWRSPWLSEDSSWPLSLPPAGLDLLIPSWDQMHFPRRTSLAHLPLWEHSLGTCV